MNEPIITSPQNPRIKRLMQLQQKSSERRAEGLFVVEGARELMHCIEAGYTVETIYFLPRLASNLPPTVARFIEQNPQRSLAVSETVYEKIAYRGSTEGVLAEVVARNISLDELVLPADPLLVVLEGVEKPGNIGAVLRSADAAGVHAVILCDTPTDLYNPNLIRSSLGALFTVPCLACTSEQCIRFLKQNSIQILTAQLQDSALYYDTDMRRPTALVMGTEATGLTDQWRQAADAHIRIPMLGQLDSLNVSVSTAILLYEAVRQRRS